MPTEKGSKSEGDNSALRRVIKNTLYNPLFVDESLADNDDDDDDDENYEPSELEKLAMMDEDEYVEYMAEYMKRYRESNNK
tara:strand:- start:100 stop:342 length:243 start_codon:yes stop_codon:yes gene_type:complete